MINLEIKPQPRLGLSELFGMTLTTQRHRIFRSFVTILVVMVATAFLVNLSLSSLVTKEIALAARAELDDFRKASRLAATFSQTYGAEAVLEALANGQRTINGTELWPDGDPAELAGLAETARFELRMTQLEESFSGPEARRVLAGFLNTKLENLDPGQAWFLFTDPEKIVQYNQLLGTLDASVPLLNVEEVVPVAEKAARVMRLEQTIQTVTESGLSEKGAGFRLGLLLGISLLVCVVGVANALLMSVTERSREIATLKCLGALDGSILSLFVLEASFIGLVGGLLGAVLGLLLAGMRLLAGYGTYALGFLDLTVVASVFLISIALGILLATCASVYPSLRAARLEPMEAMRVE